MPKSDFIIIRDTLPDDMPEYWNNNQGWITDYYNATTFDKEILAHPLPVGAYGLLEVNSINRELIREYRGLPQGGYFATNF